MRFGFGEIALLLVVILLLFGRGRVSQVMGEFGKGLKSFKRGLRDEDDAPHAVEDKKKDSGT